MLDSKSCETPALFGGLELLVAFFAERKKSLWSDLAHENTRNTFLIRVAKAASRISQIPEREVNGI